MTVRIPRKEREFVRDVMFGRVSEEDMKLDNESEYTSNKYGPTWEENRDQVRERDNYKCQACGKKESEMGRKLDVHHIKPFETFDDPAVANLPRNLISLCREHHSQLEGDRAKCRSLM